MNIRNQVASLATCMILCFLGAPARAEFVVETNSSLGEPGRAAQEMVTRIVDTFNDTINVPEQIVVGVGSCRGQENAMFVRHPDNGQGVVLICEELVDRIVQDASTLFPQSRDWRISAIAGQLLFVISHEFGHALIDTLRMPITGNEEDVADQFATWMMASEPAALLGASLFWSARANNQNLSSTAFADTHSLSVQRYYNVLCWGYGADVEARSWLASSLPTNRSPRCAGEYEQLARSLRTLLSPHEVAPGSLDNLIGSRARNATGRWAFQTVLTSDAGVRCVLSGNVVLTQLSRNLGGEAALTMNCQQGGQQVSREITLAVSDGRIEADGAVYFLADNCSFDGRFTDDSRMTLEGEVLCGGTSTLTGNFNAMR